MTASISYDTRQFKKTDVIFQIIIESIQQKLLNHKFIESGPASVERYINNIVFKGLDENIEEGYYHFSIYVFLPGKGNNFIKERMLFRSLDEKEYLLVYPRVYKYIHSKTPY